jgi:hypothetical protein
MKWLGSLLIIVLGVLAFPQVQYIANGGYSQETNAPTLEAGLSDQQKEFLYDVGELLVYAEQQGYKLTAGELTRTMYQQRENVRKGVSWTYNSKHLKRLALDVNLFSSTGGGGLASNSDPAYCDLGSYWEGLSPHNRWGGRFHDQPHFERMPNREVRSTLQEKGICGG